MSLVSFGLASSKSVSQERDTQVSSNGSPPGWGPGKDAPVLKAHPFGLVDDVAGPDPVSL